MSEYKPDILPSQSPTFARRKKHQTNSNNQHSLVKHQYKVSSSHHSSDSENDSTEDRFSRYRSVEKAGTQGSNKSPSHSSSKIRPEPTVRRSLIGHGRSPPAPSPPRLLLVSSKIRNLQSIQNAIHSNVSLVTYKYETSTLDTVLSFIAQTLSGKKVESIGLVLHGSPGSIHISGKDEKFVTKENIIEQQSIRDFFYTMVLNHVDTGWVNARLDFLASVMAQTLDGGRITDELSALLGVSVGISKDLTGSDIQMKRLGDNSDKSLCVGDLYFNLERLRNWSGHNQQSLAGFEKIRTVGKGAYGTAVLYRKKDDDSLVILKEINLHDLNASERQLALNEVKVLAMLDHPNIIGYYDSFEEDGIVMIEMEYADGGTLAQYLAELDKPSDERSILNMFQQIVAAIKHIHEHNILHRDLKTPNIFMTKEGVIKVGDFGISKMMSTAGRGANTLLGTPYYISPEMCEGKQYNDKSDIWALGCILYEMACRHKTFEGSNLPALVNKIMKGQFAPVKGNYSQEFKKLVQDMLQRFPTDRPSAKELWNDRVPELISKFNDESVTDYEDELSASNDAGNSTSRLRRRTRSVLYFFKMSTMSLSPISLPQKIKLRDIAVSESHVIALTIERMVYTWGDGVKGQLGHGDLDSQAKPKLVEALKGKSIVRVGAGDGYSVFVSDNGIVMTCGDGSFGALGHGDTVSISKPRLIEAILSIDIRSISCGPRHVAAAGRDGNVFVWGCGSDGRLGLGNEQDQCSPVEVKLTPNTVVKDVKCGTDGTMLLTDVGSLLACGNNRYNKLGLNQRQGFLMSMKNIFNKMEVDGETTFVPVRVLARHRVLSISLGVNHSAVVVEPGYVIMFGRNSEGQLGLENSRVQTVPMEVKFFREKPIFRIQCGDNYTVASTVSNDLLFWGFRHKLVSSSRLDDSVSSSKPMSPHSASQSHSRQPSTASQSHSRQPSTASQCHSRQPSTASVNSISLHRETSIDKSLGKNNTSDECSSKLASPVGNPALSESSNPIKEAKLNSRSVSVNSNKEYVQCEENVMRPTPLLQMDSSGSRSSAGDTVTLSKFYTQNEDLYIQVETTAPPPKRRVKAKKERIKNSKSLEHLSLPVSKHSVSSREGGDEYSSETSEMDTYGTIPSWIKKELAESLAEDNNKIGDPHSKTVVTNGSSMSSIHVNKNLVSEVSKERNEKLEKFVPNEESDWDEENLIDSFSSSNSSENRVNNNFGYTSRPTNNNAHIRKAFNRPRNPKTSNSGSSEHSYHSLSANHGERDEELIILQRELQKIKKEKLETEKKLKQMELKYYEEQKQILEESKHKEEEAKLQVEQLRKDMVRKLEENAEGVEMLKKQLTELKVRQPTHSSATSQSSVRESKICTLQ